jgi:hypothetical protein
MTRESWSTPAVVIVTGIQAAGKTTVGEALAGRLERSAFIDGDDLAGMVVGGRSSVTPDAAPEALAQLRLRYCQAGMLADSFHRSSFTAIIADNIYGDDLVWIAELILARPLIAVVLTRTMLSTNFSRMCSWKLNPRQPNTLKPVAKRRCWCPWC